MPSYRIAEAATLLGVSDDSVRRWIDAGRIVASRDDQHRLSIDGAELARFAVENARAAPDVRPVANESTRNRFTGLVTHVLHGTVMAQVDLQCGPYRVVSLMSEEAAVELGLEPGMTAVAAVKSTNVVIEVAADGR